MKSNIDNQLIDVFFDFSKKVHQLISISTNDRPINFSVREIIVLNIVRKKNAVTIQEIAKCLKITMPTASVLIDKLQNEGIIFKTPNPKDKRSTLIKLSPKAKNMVDKVIRIRNKKIKLCLSFISLEDKQKLHQIFKKALLKLNSQNEKK